MSYYPKNSYTTKTADQLEEVTTIADGEGIFVQNGANVSRISKENFLTDTGVAASASDAATSASNASDSETAAANSASAASTSAGNASDSEDKAQQWATEAEDTPVEPGLFSAFHWAQKAEALASRVSLADITDWPASVSATEVSYLDGVTSGIQGQIDGKLNKNSVIITDYDTPLGYNAFVAGGGGLITAGAPPDLGTHRPGIWAYREASDRDSVLQFTTTGAAIRNYTAGVADGDWITLLTSENSNPVEKTSATGSAEIPSGTTAQRDGSPSAGYLRFNSTEGAFEGYDGTEWGALGEGLGYDQSWQAVTRAAATSYSNTTGKPIVLAVSANATTSPQQIEFTIDGVSVKPNSPPGGTGAYVAGSIIVPKGSTYSFNTTGGSLSSIEAWELR